MSRLFDFTTNPPTRISTGTPASSFQEALREELTNCHTAGHGLQNANFTGPIDYRKFEAPMLPMPWGFNWRNVLYPGLLTTPGTGVKNSYGSIVIPSDANLAEQYRNHVLAEFAIPEFDVVERFNLYLMGGYVFPGYIWTSVADQTEYANPAISFQLSGIRAGGRDSLIIGSEDSPLYKLLPSVYVAWTSKTDGTYTMDDIVPLTHQCRPFFTHDGFNSGAYRIGRERIFGGGSMKIRDSGTLLVVLRHNTDSMDMFHTHSVTVGGTVYTTDRGTLWGYNGTLYLASDLSAK